MVIVTRKFRVGDEIVSPDGDIATIADNGGTTTNNGKTAVLVRWSDGFETVEYAEDLNIWGV